MKTRMVRSTAVGAAAALLMGVLASCAPDTPPTPPDPTNVANMTDEQVDTILTDALPDAQAAVADPKVMAQVPAENQAQVRRIAALMATADGRATLTAELRRDEATTRGGFATSKEKFNGGLLANVVGLSIGDFTDPGLHGTRSPAPPTIGANVPYTSTSGTCNAPGGPGTIAAPANLVPDQLLTPEHDVFAKFTFSTNGVTFFSNLAPAGETTINGDSGVEFRGSRSSWQMHVRVDVEDVNKGFPVRALYPIFHMRPLGGTAAQETQVQAVDGNIYCYAGDTEGSNRGYFDGWVPISTAEPGSQLIAEVVENDYYFRFGGEAFEPLLTAPGPQFFAGADRSTVHIGNGHDPIFRNPALTHSVGAFVSGADDPGNGTPNPLTDTNGNPADDVESAMSGLLESKVVGGLSDKLNGIISNKYAVTVWGSTAERPKATVDLGFGDPHVSFPDVTDEPNGFVGALEAALTGEAHADVGMQVLGTPCFGLTLDVAFSSVADIWADSSGFGTGITPRFKVTTDPSTNLDMPWYDWALTGCVIGFFLVAGLAPGNVEDGVNDALNGALGTNGSITKLMSGLDLDNYLPTLTIDPITVGNTTTGGAQLRPHIGNLDNAWCGATGAPPGCTNDQDLIGRHGPEIVADASLGSNDVQPIGGPIGGRFRNVFVPSTSGKIEDLVTSHSDGTGTVSALGVVVDPTLINLALRALAQGTALGATTNGLIDITNLNLPLSGYSVSTRPEVAPMVVGDPGVDASFSTFAHAVAPDLRLDLRTSSDDPKTIKFSAAATVNVGLSFNPTTRSVKPVLDSPVIDLQVTGGCQVDYTGAYATSYLFCGRGSGGNGGSGISSVTDLLDQLSNAIVAPIINDSIGSIGLPSLDGLLPGAHLALTNLRFNQRGGYLAVYADVLPMPKVSLVGSTAGYGTDDDTVRFFAVPTNIDLVNTPTSYAWTITDANNGHEVPFSYYPGTGHSAVQFASSAFTVNNPTDKRKTVNGKLMLDQTGLHVEANASFSWVPPSPVPPPNCPPAPGQFLQQLPGGVGGYGSIGVTIC